MSEVLGNCIKLHYSSLPALYFLPASFLYICTLLRRISCELNEVTKRGKKDLH